MTNMEIPTQLRSMQWVNKPTLCWQNYIIYQHIVQNLNGLLSSPTGTDNLMDRRKAENVKGESSSAPRTLLDNVKAMHNTTPANDVRSEPEGE